MTRVEAQLEELLKLEDDFDGEGSLAPKKETIERARKSIYPMHTHIKAVKNVSLGEPCATPGPKASVDLHWKTSEYEPLLNISEGDGPRNFYYTNGKDDELKGQII